MVKKIAEYMLKQTEQVQAAFFVAAPEGTAPTDTLNPIFWANVHRHLRALAKVTVMPDSGEWYQELLCVAANGPDVRMLQLGLWPLTDTSDVGGSVPDSGMIAEWGGPAHRFRVRRTQDGMILVKGIETSADAQAWIINNGAKKVA